MNETTNPDLDLILYKYKQEFTKLIQDIENVVMDIKIYIMERDNFKTLYHYYRDSLLRTPIIIHNDYNKSKIKCNFTADSETTISVKSDRMYFYYNFHFNHIIFKILKKKRFFKKNEYYVNYNVEWLFNRYISIDTANLNLQDLMDLKEILINVLSTIKDNKIMENIEEQLASVLKKLIPSLCT